MPQNMVNFGLLAAEILSLVWGTPCNFNGFRILAALLHGTLVLGVSQNCGVQQRASPIYAAGRPLGWALAHILVMAALCNRGAIIFLACDFYLSIFLSFFLFFFLA